MKTFLVCMIVVLMGGIPGCQSSRESAPNPLSAKATSSIGQTEKTGLPATESENSCRVEAVVESIQPINADRFMVGLFVLKSTRIGGSGNLIEPTQRVIASPRFVTDASGTMDTSSPVNISFRKLRAMPAGSTIKGMLSVDHRGAWQLLSIDEQ